MPNDTARQDTDAFERAALAWRMAPFLCPWSQPPAFDCTFYHRVRPLLRLLGLTAQPSDHGNFFATEVSRAVLASGPRILVSGASDEGMMQIVLAAASEHGRRLSLTIADRCQTPILVNQHCAVHQNLPISCVVANMLELKAPQSFDAIVTHSFIGQIAPENRGQLYRNWYDLLRPSGRLITNSVLTPPTQTRRFEPQDVERFAGEAQRRFAALKVPFPISPEEVARATAEYASVHRTWPVRSLEEITSALEQSGFAIEQAGVRRSKQRVTDIKGPAVPAGSNHAEVVAVRL
jgi:hypothetical protein